jgi:hypothetical protein
MPMIVVIGVTYPDLMTHSVINSATPYPHTFLLTVADTKISPATGLYESMEYVIAMAAIAETYGKM